MQLRHIRPRSMEWYDAMVNEGAQGFGRINIAEAAALTSASAEAKSGKERAREGLAGTRGTDTLGRVRHIRERPGGLRF
jgi:hypothetical protein